MKLSLKNYLLINFLFILKIFSLSAGDDFLSFNQVSDETQTVNIDLGKLFQQVDKMRSVR